MIKRCYLVVIYGVLMLWASVISAQTVQEEGAAVKLGSGATIKNTIVWGNKGKQLEGGKTPVNCHIQGVNGAESPLFQDSSRSDFRLGKGSPCIDMGADDPLFADPAALDLWGNKRVNNRIDIGANEYRTYKINFVKDPQVGIIQDIAGITYDSAKVEPGEKYLFKPDYSKIAGITADMVVVQKLEGGEKLTPNADGVYTLPVVNSDITIIITLTPPIVVTVEEALYGTLTVTRHSNGQTVPDNSGKNSITVEKNEYIRLDTVSLPGYYCDAVFMRLKEPAGSPETSVKDKVGKDNGIQITESIFCRAEFKPLSYPVKLRVNDPDMGQITVVNNKDGETYTLPAGSSTYQKAVVYGADKTFSVTITTKPGYGVKSVKIYDGDGTSNPKDITATINKTVDMRVGGLVIDVVFEPAQYTVSWNCSNGDLNVTPGTEVNMPGGGKKVEVAYGTVITVQPLANGGYEYVANSLKAQLGDGTQQALPDDTKQWTVLGNITLLAQFSALRPQITIDIDQPTGANNGVTTDPVLGADNRVDYGTSLTLSPAAKPGYHCSEIWIDGVKQVSNSSAGLPSIEQDVTVKFVFVPDEFAITYVNSTPAFGTLLVERQQSGTTGWTAYTGSPGKANYLDKIKVTATPVNEHYLLDVLTLTSVSAGQVAILSGAERSVEEALTVNASFKPKEYPVTLSKVDSPEKLKGKIVLKDKATGNVLVKLEKAETASASVNIPYGTEVLVEWECDQNYGVESVNKITTAGTVSILNSRMFTVEGPTEVQAKIYLSTNLYSVNWKIDQPAGSVGNELNVYENAEGDISIGDRRAEGTLLKIKTGTAAGDTLIALTDQFGNILSSPYSLNQNLEVTAKFVRKCKIRILEPAGATVTVSKDGVMLADGAIVPAGSVLQCVITANSSFIGCKSLKVNDVAQWTGTITTTTPPPSTSGNIGYTIPETYGGGEIWFSGVVDTYYKVEYTAANFGSFTVKAETGVLGEELVPGRQYWYPSNGTVLELKAQETVAGYVFNADRKVVNQAVVPNDEIILNGSNGVYSAYSLLEKDMDLVTTFEIRGYDVDLEVVLPAGKTLAEVGAVSLTGGAAVLNDKGNTKVNYNGILTLNVVANAGYAVRIKDGGITKQSGLSGTYVYNTLPAKAAVALEVEFIPLYQVNYGTDVAKVCRPDGTVVANGDRAYAGEILKAYSAAPSEVGKECKEVKVQDAMSGTSYGSSTATLTDGTIEYEFTMPEADVRVAARFDWINYDLSLSLNAPLNAGTLSVVKVDGGIETPVIAGTGVLSYGDLLKVTVALQPVTGGSPDTWYEVSSFSALMGGNNVAFTPSVSGLDHVYTFNIPVSEDVDIVSVIMRKMQNLIVRVTPVNSGFNVKVQIDGGTPVEYDSYQSIRVPVGVPVEAWAQMTAAAPNGYELSSFPGTGEKETHVSKTVPLTTDLYLSAIFSLKKYPLNVKTVPDDGGRISFRDNSGNYYAKGKYSVEYGTVLSNIVASPENDYFRLSGITGFMGGADRFAGQTSPYQIDKVVDSVGIEARFEKLYKVVKNASVHGTMDVFEAGTTVSAEGSFYPAGSAFAVHLLPADESFTCTSAQVLLPGSGTSAVSLAVDDQGKAFYTIPNGLVATDLVFVAHFEKKKYNVTLNRTPDEGGTAELWQDNKATGTLLASLVKDDPALQVVVADVEHGTVIDFYTEADLPTYEVAEKTRGVEPYSAPVTIVSDTVFTVKFGKRYQVNIVDPGNIHVYRENGVEVLSGELIPEGLALKVKARKTGHNYTRLSVFKADDNTEYRAWNAADADGAIEESFVMPAYDVKIDGVNEPKKYTVTIVQPLPAGYTSLTAVTVPLAGTGVGVGNGDKVEYLTSLRVSLTPHEWYNAGVISATVGGVPRGVTESGGTFKIDGIDGDVVITATVVRKQKLVNILLDSELNGAGNVVIVKTEDGTEHSFVAAGQLLIDVGAPLEIRPQPAVGYKAVALEPVPGTPVTTEPIELYIANMPDNDISVTARFAIKTYPVYFTSNAGGSIVVNTLFNGVSGQVANSGDEVKHFTQLTISALPLDDRYRLKKGSLITEMGGVAVSDPTVVASVSGVVNIQAEFEKLYKIERIAPETEKGELSVTCADTNAVGYRYPAATALKVTAEPKEGYELLSVEINGNVLPGIPPEGGDIIYNIPDDTSVDVLEFKANYALKEYKVTLIATGKGVMTVDGWPGGTQNIVNTSVTSSSITHFTNLKISVLADELSYLVDKFVIYLPDGSQKTVTGADTTITIAGNTNVEVVFKKYYWIVYDKPEYGQLVVQENGNPVVSGARYPGLTTLTVGTVPEEGYEVETLTANDADVLHNSVTLPLQDAVYDTLYLEAKFKLKTHTLTVIQPKEGKISVEKSGANGVWEPLDVTQPVALEYWTQIRMQVSVDEIQYNEFKELTVNGNVHTVGDPWVIKSDCQVEALIAPRLFTVNFEQPLHGRLQVVTDGGAEVVDGGQVPYRTRLVVTADPNDPEGYRVTEIKVNGQDIENGSIWEVDGNVRIKASIAINRWEVVTSVTGQGELPLLYRDESPVQSPVDSVEHYQVLKISSRPSEGWQLYTLDVFGAEVRSDSTIMVTQDIQVNAVFRKKEPYLFPAVFTPNGDGYNDSWVVSGLWQSPDNTLEIYDRQQRRVYKSSPYMNEWEGQTDNGKVLPAGTYVYKFTTATGEEFMGLVSIMRN